MVHSRTLRRSLALAAVLALAAPAASQAADGDRDRDRTFFATDNRGNLLKFDSDGKVDRKKRITGLAAGVSLKGIDFRPATGDLYGVGSDSKIYRVNPKTAIACTAGATMTCADGAAFTPPLNGSFFGFDFNPTVDRIRITSDADQNLRLNPNNGQVVPAGVDGTLQFGPGVTPGNPNIVGSAYENSSFSATLPAVTELYAIDSNRDTLYTQDPPNAGTLVEPQRLDVNVGNDLGFDIDGRDNTGYFVTRAPDGKRGAVLYTLDTDSGRTKSLGRVGKGGLTLTGLAIVQGQSGS